MDAVYEVDGSRVLTSSHAGGPWDPGLQHGAAPASLISWAAERVPTPVPMQVTRLSLDLMRPVPVGPLDIETKVLREGRKIQLCAVHLSAGGVEVVRGSVLKVRIADLPLPESAGETPLDLPLPEAGREASEIIGASNPFLSGLSFRIVKGGFREAGPAAVWWRAERPIVRGAAISPLMRAAIAADFCNGTSAVLDFKDWTFINGDLTVSLARMPVGDWVLLDAETWLGPAGTGIAFARLGDRQGYFGRAVQSLVVEAR